MLKKNDIINLKIESITNLGFGVGRHEGLVIFVSDAVTGDEAEVKIIKLTPSYAVGRVEKFIKTFELRDTSRCNNKSCHSCAYKSISYAHEKELKQTEVKEAFKKAGLSEVKIESLVGSPSCKNYRNKAQYPISMSKNGEYVIGFYAPKSHRVTDAVNCPLAPEIFSDIIKVLTAFFKKHMLSVYNEEVGQGLLRHVYLRRGEVSGEILLTLVINGASLPHSDELVKVISKKFSDVVGVLLNVNKKNTNVILGEKFITLYGRDYIYDTLAGVRLKITAPAFYQVNHDAAELLYKKAKELANPKKSDTILDIYCGAGSIGLSMADSAGEIFGIEIIDSAVLCARENAKSNGIKNAKFYTGDAANTEKLLDNAEGDLGRKINPNVVVLDPPRAGCDEVLINYVASLSPEKVVYISCNPSTLARDCAVFKALGYICGSVTPFDLFPLTGHVESVVCLKRQIQQ
ncbi:MAG: 23S rRNA (uracil(1939)-C(5))-methyltransferase RlmD [Ruminococcaceae bacterium]|nr:23S rRNA (uracil(1939)-C(5))-methyltransferase RlmD [Oscillospiraceae bacterium]